MVKMPGGEMVMSGVSGFMAKQVASGLLKRFAKEWTIEGFREAYTNGYGLTRFFEVSPYWANTVKGALEKFKNLHSVSANELLSWIKDSNPLLFKQICEEPDIIGWLFKSWEEAKTELIGPKNLTP